MESFAKISPSSSSSTTSLPFLVLNSFCNDFLVNFLGLDDEMWVKVSLSRRSNGVSLGGHQVGKQTLHVLGDHFFRQTQNCNLDETQRGFDDLSVSGGKKQFHSLVKIGQQLDIHLGVEFVNQTRERSDGSTNHVGGGTSKTGRTNGEEFLQRCNRIWHFWVIQTVSHWSSLVLQHFGSHNN
ncbi:hypothetical protein OGAPHI_002662 [Ogataea philodendri]|uniref:Uncharacterized protein n=1 Tax=Ogataea philodendri TaxID=1378263 RepID=A0A9P8PCS1_9ASCO|nr:uncharacterized protein OGAPHI_002662 [Ogataea philodendri]KAH3668907.1 hypothetical protein OGAPHI_002662 [Ogataea philodendri]